MKRFLLTGILLLFSAVTYAQGNRDLVINEVLVNNVNNYEDDYGHRVSWIELYNTGFSMANVASCYLVIESGTDTTLYRIPKNDPRTAINPQGYIVFFCEGTQTKGTFHTNFTLDMGTPKQPVLSVEGDSTAAKSVYPDKVITLSLLEANGRDTLSKVVYNLADQQEDVAMGLHPNPDGVIEFMELGSTTPYATNITTEELPAHERFRRTDPIGYGMAITAMSVVLLALFLLYICFRTVGRVMLRHANKGKQSKTETASAEAPLTTLKAKPGAVNGEELAAIAIALKMYEDDLHDNESTVLTINRVAKAYSPWSSKIYGLTPSPDRRR